MEVVKQWRKYGDTSKKGGGEKRSIEGKKEGSRKRRKYALFGEDWGAPMTDTREPKEGPVERGEEQLEKGGGGADVCYYNYILLNAIIMIFSYVL